MEPGPTDEQSQMKDEQILDLEKDLQESDESSIQAWIKVEDADEMNTAFNAQFTSLRTQIKEERPDAVKELEEKEKELVDCQLDLQAHALHRRAVEEEYRKQETILQQDVENERGRATKYKEKYEQLSRVADRVPSLEDSIKDLVEENTAMAISSQNLTNLLTKYVKKEAGESNVLQFSLRGSSLLLKPCQTEVTTDEIEDYLKEKEDVGRRLKEEKEEKQQLQQQQQQLQQQLESSARREEYARRREEETRRKKRQEIKYLQSLIETSNTEMKRLKDELEEKEKETSIDVVNKNREIARLQETLERYKNELAKDPANHAEFQREINKDCT